MTERALDIIFAGSGELGVPTLRALAGAGHRVVQVVSQPDRPAGRGRSLAPTPISQEAMGMGLPLVRTENINGEALAAADVMVVIAFGQKISSEIVNHPRLGSINLHASRLPKFRGAAPINWAMLAGETVTGNSVIRLAQRMDAGAVLGHSEVVIRPTETAGELHDRLAEDGVGLILRVLDQLAHGTAVEMEQDESKATLAPKLSRKSAVLDFSQPVDRVARTVRGLYPWPGCRVRVVDLEGAEVARMRLVRAVVAGEDGPRWEMGEITSAGTVQCGDGCMEVLECQPDGGKAMTMADYRRGHRWQAGLRLVGVE